MASPAALSSVMTSVAPQFIGKASGTFSALRQLGGAFGVAVLVAVFAAAGGYGSAQTFTDGFQAAIAACGGLALAAALAGSALPGRRPAPAQVAPSPPHPLPQTRQEPT
jgi:hypothetical protein